jgi:acyl-CoA synthetase (AMP-forming)/AMP-acid ligase II
VIDDELKTDWQTWLDVLGNRAERNSTDLAFTLLGNGEDETASIRFGGLDRQARAIAVSLRERSPAGEPVLLLYPSGLEFIAAFFGCLYAGAVAVPAYPPRSAKRSTERLDSIIANSGVRLALTDKATQSRIAAAWKSDSTPKAIDWLAIGEIDEHLSDDWAKPDVDANTIALLQYTSGSTAHPKGVAITHGNLLHNSEMIRQAFAHEPGRTFVGWLPMYHDMGLIGNILQTVFVGNHIYLMPPEAFLMKPVRWLSAISKYRACSSGGPNFAYELCAQRITDAQKKSLDLSCWNVAFTGAEPVRAETLDRFCSAFADCGFRRETFYPCYGLAEATLFVTGGQIANEPVVRRFDSKALAKGQVRPVDDDEAAGRALVACGSPWSEQEVIIVDPESAVECGADEIGEICVSGPSVAANYWNHQEATDETFAAKLPGRVSRHEEAHGSSNRADRENRLALRTGDLGFLYDGQLFITGRLKDMMIVSGRNYFAEDIERTVEGAHPAIRPHSTAAFAVEIGREERPVVVVELDRHFVASFRTTKTRLIQTLQDVVGAIRMAVTQQHDLSLHAVQFVRQAAIPRTSSGKIQRSRCQQSYLNGSLRTIDICPMTMENTIDVT